MPPSTTPPPANQPLTAVPAPGSVQAPSRALDVPRRPSTPDDLLRELARQWHEPELCACCPNTARITDHFLDGSTYSYGIDREWSDAATRILPSLQQVYRDERAFRDRALGYALQERGIQRFLDLGSGLPNAGAIHRITGTEAHVVCADSDQLINAHLNLLATETDDFVAITGDLLVPGTILAAGPTEDLLRTREPICLVLTGVLDSIADTAALTSALRCYTERLAPRSLVIVSHATTHGLDPADPAQHTLAEQMRTVCQAYQHAHTPQRMLRDPGDLEHILDGLTILAPGITHTRAWCNPAQAPGACPAESLCLAAVAEVPGR